MQHTYYCKRDSPANDVRRLIESLYRDKDSTSGAYQKCRLDFRIEASLRSIGTNNDSPISVLYTTLYAHCAFSTNGEQVSNRFLIYEIVRLT